MLFITTELVNPDITLSALFRINADRRDLLFGYRPTFGIFDLLISSFLCVIAQINVKFRILVD